MHTQIRIRLVDLVERVVWTTIAAGLGALVAAPLISIDALEAAIVAALGGAVNAVLVIARWRLAVLPDPGAGLPGAPTSRQT